MKTILHISGMHCPACKKLIEMEVGDLQGVESITLDSDTGEAIVIYDEQQVDIPTIKATIRASGEYTVA